MPSSGWPNAELRLADHSCGAKCQGGIRETRNLKTLSTLSKGKPLGTQSHCMHAMHADAWSYRLLCGTPMLQTVTVQRSVEFGVKFDRVRTSP